MKSSIELNCPRSKRTVGFYENRSWWGPSVYLCPTSSSCQFPPDCILLLFEVPSLRVNLESNPTEKWSKFHQTSNRGMFSWQMPAPPWLEAVVTWLDTSVAQLTSEKSSFEGSHMRVMSKNWSMSKTLNPFGNVENKFSGTSRYHFWIAYEKFYRAPLSSFQTNGWILSRSRLKSRNLHLCSTSSSCQFPPDCIKLLFEVPSLRFMLLSIF